MLKIKIHKKDFKIIVVFFLISLGLTISHASNNIFGWIGPTENPPGGNVTFQTSCEKILGILVCDEGYKAECVLPCAGLNGACSINGDCCDTNHVCKSWGVCQPIGVIADACVVDADCEASCQTGCPIFPNYQSCCLPNGSVCTTSEECCGGGCLGTCGAGESPVCPA